MDASTLDLSAIRALIDRADSAYYRPGLQPIMSDADYDALKSRLKVLYTSDHRLTRVGVPYDPHEIAQKVQHDYPMGSLDNTDGGIEGVKAWYDKMASTIKTSSPQLLVSYKLDGSSVALKYKDGVLVRAVTRGNGSVGEDITANAALFQGVPTVLSQKVSCTIRGEAVLHRVDFERITQDVDPEDKGNPRNQGNGIIGRDDGQDCDLIRFYAFNLIGLDCPSEHTKLRTLEDLGFEVAPHQLCCPQLGGSISVLDQVTLFYDHVLDYRCDLPMEIDGLVVVLNQVEYQAAFKNGDVKSSLRPKYARAIKFPAHTVTTRVTGVTLTIGHQGSVVPTLDVERVRLGGIFCDSVIVTNFDTINDHDLAIGDTITVELAGDIVPYLGRVMDRPANRIPITEPISCPSCGSPTTRENRGSEGANLYCTNPNCTARLKRKVQHWIGSSRKGIGILDIGDEIMDALWEAGLVRDAADLYKLSTDQLTDLVMKSGIRIGVLRATTICDNIQNRSTVGLPIFLGALGIDLLGTRRAQLLIKAAVGQLDTITDWLDDTKLATLSLTGLGDITRAAIRAGIDQNRELITKLLSSGVKIMGDVKPVTGGSLSGTSWCFTGTRELLAEVEAAGGEIKSGVAKGLGYLVQKDATKSSNKSKKAEALGVKIIGLDQLKAILAGEAPLP